MKHFIVDIHYRVPAESLGEIVGEHRAFLQEGYASGLLLCSGPKVPKTGGMVVARAATLAELAAYFERDPYQVHGVADHTYTEFDPVFFQPVLADWVAGEPVRAA